MYRKLTIPNDVFFEQIQVYLSAGKSVSFFVKGHSMRPFIHEGDKVTVKAIPLADLRNGMIALAHADQGYVLHRVVGIRADGISLAGDGNLSQIELIENSKLMGVVQKAFRGDAELPVCTSSSRMKGLIWYYVRPIRRIFRKIKR